MGLDMFLTARRYLYGIGEGKVISGKILKLLPKIKGKGYRVKGIDLEVGYWRSAHAIHNWFVENVQDSNDDCNSYSVEEEQLKELLSIVQSILKDRTRAKELLPDDDYNEEEYSEDYFNSLKETEKILVKLFESGLLEEDWNIEYRSSW